MATAAADGTRPHAHTGLCARPAKGSDAHLTIEQQFVLVVRDSHTAPHVDEAFLVRCGQAHESAARGRAPATGLRCAASLAPPLG